MALWVMKGGRQGEREHRMLEHGVLGAGWSELDDLSRFRKREELESAYRRTYPDASPNRVANHVGQLWAFINDAQKGDLVVVPLKTQATVAIGEIIGPYACREDFGIDMRHTRPVKWLRTDVPRTKFGKDLLYTFGAFMTFCRAKRNDAENRVRSLLAKGADPGFVAEQEPEPGVTQEEFDIEQVAKDQIVRLIQAKFKGHAMATLVDAVLKAQGFVTKVAEPGPDGGVDILAAPGPLGFDHPRLCVQVKSQAGQVDLDTFRGLLGILAAHGADQGLLVAWGGFRQSVEREARTSFFKVRLWDQERLVEALFANYERLPEEIKAELPLKRVWALAAEPEEE